MGASRQVWVGVTATGAVMVIGGLVWLFAALGTEQADRISSGIGAGAALVGLLIGALGAAHVRTHPTSSSVPGHDPTVTASPELRPAIHHSVHNSSIGGANIQIGGSVSGAVTAYGGSPADQPRDPELAGDPRSTEGKAPGR